MGFVVMGFIGYFVKLIHIPINNIVRRCRVVPVLLDTLLTPLRSLQLVYVPTRTGRCSCATRPAHRQTRD